MLITSLDQFQQLKHGQKITCIIDGTRINDAKIAIERGIYYICQNLKDGSIIKDKLGYKYSWVVECNSDWGGISNVETLDKTNLEDMEENDILINHYGDERKVLAVCGQAFLPSLDGLIEADTTWYSFQEAIQLGWKFKETPQEETEVVLTMEEIAEKFNIPVKQLRIKD